MRSLQASFLMAHDEFYDSLDSYRPDEACFLAPTRACLPAGWRTTRGGAWWHCQPPDVRLPRQGWKIHLSATVPTSRAILDAAVPVLLDAGVPFKVALDARVLHLLNSKRWSRGQAGKFVTIYPRAETEFLALLDRLDEATRTHAGPYILSDRRYKESRVVYYRYGAIAPTGARDVTGAAMTTLEAPGGGEVPDVRAAYFVLPSWLTDPVMPAATEPAPVAPTEILLRGGRYRVDEVIRFSNTGGIYLADDRHEGRRVVIKEARPGVGIGSTADDAIALLQREFRILEGIVDLGIGPRPVELFQEWEHWFLVEEYIEGSTIPVHRGRNFPLYKKEPTADVIAGFTAGYVRLFAALARGLDRLHRRGVVFGDLSSTNVLIVDDASTVRLVDFETAFTDDEPPLVTDIFTAGFALRTSAMRREPPSLARDRYALGVLMLSYLFPITPLLEVKPEAAHEFLAALERDLRLPAVLRTIITRLMDVVPAHRPSAAEVAEILEALNGASTSAIQPRLRVESEPRVEESPTVDEDERRARVERTIAYILSTADFDRDDRLFPSDPALFTTNPLSVAYGACGVGAALQHISGSCPAAIVEWILRRRKTRDVPPPGLYVGLSGIAWTLLDLGLRQEAVETLALADGHPRLWDAPDVFYGVAGWGLTQVKFFRVTGDEQHLARARDAAEWLWRRRVDRQEGACWHSIDHVYFGLTRGASGVGLFFLSLYLADHNERWLRAAQRALEFELAHAVESPSGGLSWPYHIDQPVPVLPYWQYGTAGVAAFLLRYVRVTGDPRGRALIDRLVEDMDHKYAVVAGFFRGLAGLGAVLIDAYRLTGDPRYLERARSAEEGLRLFAIRKPTGDAYPGEGLARISCDFGTGGAGIALFQSRLVSRSAPPFMLDEWL